MKQRAFSIILTLAMVLSLLPGPARAADPSAPGGTAATAKEFADALGKENAEWSSDSGTITLKKNVTGVDQNITVKNSFTLNLNGFTLTMGSSSLIAEGKKASLKIEGGGTITGSSSGGIVRAQLGGKLTVDGIAVTGAAGSDGSVSKAAGIADGREGTVTVKNTTITNVSNGIIVNGDSDLYYYDTSIQSTNAGIITNGTNGDDFINPRIYIYSGTVMAVGKDSVGLYLPAIDGETYVYGGTIVGGTGVEIRSGRLTIGPEKTEDAVDVSILGGSGEGAGARKTPAGSAFVTQNAGIGIAPYGDHGTIKVTINGGEISGSAALYQDVPTNGEGTKIDLEVTGGKFTGADDDRKNGFGAVVVNKETALLDSRFITGGTFQTANGSKGNGVKTYLDEAVGIDAAGNVVEEGSYTITFNANGGKFDTGESTLTKETDASGKLSTLPAPPTYDDHFFEGWYTETEAGNPINVPYEFTGDTTVYAHWTEIHTVTFNPNGGTLTGDTTAKTGSGGKLSALPTPIRYGYTFEGWYTAAEGGFIVTKDTKFDEDITVYAHWTTKKPPHYITFDANGGAFNGTNRPTQKTQLTDNKGILSSLPSPAPTCTGYVLEGWYTASEAGNPINVPYTFIDDTTLYAHWTKTYTITFNPNGGTLTGDGTATTGADRTLSAMPADPTYYGHTFLGWYTAAEGGTKVTANTEFNEDTTIYAHWEEKEPPHNITFDANGGAFGSGDNSQLTQTLLTDDNGVLSKFPTDPIWDEYFFDAWYTEAEAGAQINIPYQFIDDTTVYAHWTPKPTYTITFAPNGGTLTGDNTATTGRNGKLSKLPTDPVRDGYTFEGWFTITANGEEKVVANETVFTSDTTVYARWSKSDSVQQTVFSITFLTFSPDGGTLINSRILTTDIEGKLPVLPPDPVFDGYTFEGWYMTTVGGEERVLANETVFTRDTTVYARWSRTDGSTTTGITITFNANGGTLAGNNKAATGTDGRLSTLPVPTRDGYIFDGWYTAAEGGTKVTTDTVFAQDTTIFAHWTPQSGAGAGDTYTITLDANGGTLTDKTATTGADGKLAQLPAAPTREGYAFDGWYTAAEGGTKVTTDTVFTQNTTIYAHWTQAPTGDYIINLIANPAEGGSVAGGGYYNKGASVTVTAVPASGYRFAYWVEDGVAVSTSAAYTFIATASRTLTAEFTKTGGNGDTSISPTYRVIVSAASNGDMYVTRETARPGDKVIITAKPIDGYIAGSVSVTDRDGSSIFVRDNGNDTYTFTMPASPVTVSAAFTDARRPSSYTGVTTTAPVTPVTPAAPAIPDAFALQFTDVFSSNWFYPSVQYVSANGLMTGDGSATIFNPAGTTTRAMVWTVLGRMSSADVNGSGAPWYAKARSWAITNDISDGTNPTGGISRQELMTMLWRYMGSPAATADLSRFSDRGAVAEWAGSAMQWAVSKGLIVGDDGRLNPAGNAKRSEVAAIFMRFCENIKR